MKATLVFFKENGERRDLSLPAGKTVAGRDKACDLRIPLPSVSRRHCAFTLEGETLRVEDLGSSNGTYRNGEELKQAVELEPGDQIAVGSVIFTVVMDGDPSHVEPPLLEAPSHQQQKASSSDSSGSSMMTGVAPSSEEDSEGSSMMTGVGPSSEGSGSAASGGDEDDIGDLIRRTAEAMDDDSGLDFDLDLDDEKKS